MAPSDEVELMHMVATACGIDDRPSAIRYPRGEALGLEMPARGTPLEIGMGRIVREGGKVAILAVGTRLQDALLAADATGTAAFMELVCPYVYISVFVISTKKKTKLP